VTTRAHSRDLKKRVNTFLKINVRSDKKQTKARFFNQFITKNQHLAVGFTISIDIG